MSVKARGIRVFVFIVLAVLAVFLSACDGVVGFGREIDFEPPVLTLDPVPNPLYVRQGTTLSGTVTDNIAVDRVILRDTADEGKEIFRATLLPGNRWEMALAFTEEDNGKKFGVEIVGYDKSGNSGDSSITFINIIIDIRPPVMESVWIERSPAKIAYLEPYHILMQMETEDSDGENIANVNRYQNGWFSITAKVFEEETRIEDVVLTIYDVRDPDTPLLSRSRDSGASLYSPRWLVKEEDILDAGDKMWPGYKTNYYNGERYYYRVILLAYDKSENEGTSRELVEDQDFFCLWEKGDEPRGIYDTSIGTTVMKGVPLPVHFFDDDSLEWAYADMLTENQWADISGATDEAKLSLLGNTLRSGGTVNNWKADDAHPGYPESEKRVAELIEGKSTDEKVVYIQTGKEETDYGNFVLFTLAGDKKLEPHDGNGPADTNRNRWKGRAYRISVVDDNYPLIVFDTVDTTDPGYDAGKHSGGSVLEPIAAAMTGNSPEENTFPKLTDGRFFEINGYTLRESTAGNNSVKVFRIAWIPYGVIAGSTEKIVVEAVQNAMRWEGTDDAPANPYPAGVQYWDLTAGMEEGTPQDIGSSTYKKQVFRKKFDVLGGADDLKPEYNNFNYNGALENEPKVFVFFAMDNMNHAVYRTIRLLPNKTPPSLAIYDISGKPMIMPAPPPRLNDFASRTLYETELRAYNMHPGVYSALRGVSLLDTGTGTSLLLTDSDKTSPYQTYTMGTVLKYWIMAETSGDLSIENIKMQDITYSDNVRDVGSVFNVSDQSLSYCETLPGVDQRVFLFTAEDSLGNIAQIQRTISVTDIAELINLSTTRQNGSYGIGEVITIQANFSGQISVQPGAGGEMPELNIRYPLAAGGYAVESIECNPVIGTTLFLEFDFTVPEGAAGRLETMYGDPLMGGNSGAATDRPIRLRNGARVIDVFRNEPVFTPGNVTGIVTMPNWTTADRSLQAPVNGKNIDLDGVRPGITGMNVSGKTPWQASPDVYYFRTGETISFTLLADKDITYSGTPILRYYIQEPNGTMQGPYDGAFTYQRPSGSSGMVFSLAVNAANLPFDGELVDVSLFTGAGTIEDYVGNSVELSTVSGLMSFTTARVYIDQTIPAAPVTTLTTPIGGSQTVGAVPTTTIYFNETPTLEIASPANEPWPVTTQYSFDGGLTWTDYSAATDIADGTWSLRTRYVDRAGNEGASCDQLISINVAFPRLISVGAVQPDGTYRNGNLEFMLNFDDQVRVENASNVSITLTNRAAPNTHNPDGVSPSYQIVLTAAAGQTGYNTSIRFEWNGITGKEMRDGLYISSVTLTGLRDVFGNQGGTGTGTADFNYISMGFYSCPNLSGGVKVDTIAPRLVSSSPVNAAGILTSDFTSSVMSDSDNRIITLTFSEDVIIGSGTITVRPYGNYAIPPVFEHEGYYLGTDGNRYTAPGNNRTWVAGFYDVYNSGNLGATARGNLTAGSSLSSLNLSLSTGLSTGPYQRTTHGLKEGNGYTGNYTGTNTDGPNPVAGRMVPDTDTKWVLDYQYQINQDISVVNNIRDALNLAKFRWQELSVASTVISGNTVTITLNEPLLKGLQWQIYYPVGTFKDAAGNNAPGIIEGEHWFWSNGVQTPVIRVDRRSYDARTAVDLRAVPAYPGTAASTTPFNTVSYRVESETPGAAIFSAQIIGVETGADELGSITGNFTGTVNGITWDSVAYGAPAGTWVRTNLVRRAGQPVLYTVMENGYSVTRVGLNQSNGASGYRGYRSYNRDISAATLNVAPVNLTPDPTNMGSFTYDSYQASKNYVHAVARVDHANSGGVTSPVSPTVSTSGVGYEGVFRTVVMLNNPLDNNPGGWATLAPGPNNNAIQLTGSNDKNGMPTIDGFPIQDAAVDLRYVKLYNRVSATTYYWVSTEIVCEFYEISFASSYARIGEVDNYVTVGYGDLTYSHERR